MFITEPIAPASEVAQLLVKISWLNVTLLKNPTITAPQVPLFSIALLENISWLNVTLLTKPISTAPPAPLTSLMFSTLLLENVSWLNVKFACRVRSNYSSTKSTSCCVIRECILAKYCIACREKFYYSSSKSPAVLFEKLLPLILTRLSPLVTIAPPWLTALSLVNWLFCTPKIELLEKTAPPPCMIYINSRTIIGKTIV